MFYFRSTKIPIDPYYGAAMLATIRAMISILSSSIVGKFKRRTMFIACDSIMICGTLLLATYCYFNQDESLTDAIPYAKWIPIIAILFMYIAFSFGVGSIPYAYQVNNCFNITTIMY